MTQRSHVIEFEDGAADAIKQPVHEKPVIIKTGAEDGEPKPFPLECLPGSAGEMAAAICESLNVPASLPGPSVLGILSASTGAGLQVRSGGGRITRGNLYIIGGAESGAGKSETEHNAAKPLKDFAKERRELWEKETLPGLLAEEEILKRQMKARGKEAEASQPQLESLIGRLRDVEEKLKRKPKVWTQDATTQTLPVLMAGQPLETLTSLSADAREVADIITGKWNKGGRTDENFFVQAWTGDAYEGDRIGRSELSLSAPCLSALWLVQPDKVNEIFSQQTLTDSGFLPRILVCLSECEPQEIDHNRKGIPEAVSDSYGALIRELLEAFRTAQEPTTIDATQEAREALDNHFNELVKRRRGEFKDVNSFASRWTEQAWRIAVCLHAGEHGRRAGEYSLSLETARNAIRIADWFAKEQLTILHAGREAKRRDKWEAVLSLLADKAKGEGITPRDVQRNGIERNAENARALLESMADAENLQRAEREAKGGGRPVKDCAYVKA